MKSSSKNSPALKINTLKVPRTISSCNLRKKTPLSPALNQAPPAKVKSFRHLSPFQQITSKAVIYTHLLPSFCRVLHSPKNLPLALPSYTTTENPKKSASNTQKSRIYSEISQFFYSDSQIFDTICIKTSGLEASIHDLTTLKPGQTLSDTMIKMSLKAIHKKNRMRILHNKQPTLNAYFIDWNACEKIATNEIDSIEGVKKDLTKFSLIVFPLFLGYWVLAICDNDSKVIKLFDPLGIESQEKMIKKGILKYLTKDVKENRVFRKFRIESFNESDVYDQADSGVYVLMQIFKNCVKPCFEISPEGIERFRVKVLYYLLLEFYEGL